MAEGSAHLTELPFNSKHTPSFFDIIAADALNSSLFSAYNRLAKHIFQGNRLNWLLKFSDEIYYTVNILIQTHYLKNYGASLSETFYGLTRKNNKTNRFDKKDFYSSLFVVAVVPYLLRKLEKKIYEDEDYVSKNIFLMKLYHNIKGLYQLLKLVQYLKFLTKFSSTCHLNNQLCSLRLEYAITIDENWSFSDVIKRKVNLTKALSNLFFRSLELSAFFVQFLQWFRDERKSLRTHNIKSPDIPLCDFDEMRNVCPMCQQLFSVPIAISLSGYVYCYKCLFNYFDIKGYHCPISLHPVSLDDLINLHEKENLY